MTLLRYQPERLAYGYLCWENGGAYWGCRGDNGDLEELLRQVTTPDPGGWRQVSKDAWRWYGTTPSGQRLYVEVRRNA